ncbi:ChrR family anti-sigma-E factor [Pseudomonas cichorii]|uniref:Transcriptional regulator n=1 Tax=Pseudomonas cichorii TaxID=36746 RepID=A0ABQ1DQD7_PSECI|nr:ChrR family anti-sigma-E factor [Pseudomonas cichorii]AHF65289.1 transcriptional activator ChrR [Pseudomonas cichorii JBC1]QVE19551.1 ChrR family anti-sigma-E factor [Pseudomonas cichorii]GFM93197.1 transcriptional regulator [Pseudomonas cichorii]SDO44536.1 anti-ECFsigma factor, ChrR [Pseudomonas cichorii]
MSPVHHPDEATLVSYASGALAQTISLVTAAHFEQCAECRDRLRHAERIGGLLIQQYSAAVEPAKGRDAMLARLGEPPRADVQAEPVVKSPDLLPVALHAHFGRYLSEQPWKTLLPGVQRVRAKGFEQGNLMLLRIAPGVSMPLHSHEGSEMTLVLQGSYHDELGEYRPGDLADLDSDTQHQPTANGDEYCICVMGTDSPLRFQGLVARMLQPIFGI